MIGATLELVSKATVDPTVVSGTLATTVVTDGGVDMCSTEHPKDFSTSTYTERRRDIGRVS